MINSELHKKPVVLDVEQHRGLRHRTDLDPTCAVEGVNVVFLAALEFGRACKEFPIVFIRAGTSPAGKVQLAPVAVMGLRDGENFYLERDLDGCLRWSAQYTPAFLRLYPFTLAPIDAQRWGVCLDEAWAGWSSTEGEALFDAAGQPSPFLAGKMKFIQELEAEVERTRAGCERLLELGLLQERVFNVELADGSKFSTGDFYAINEERLQSLSKSEIADLFRSGLLGLLIAHQISLDNMVRLAERRSRSQAASSTLQ